MHIQRVMGNVQGADLDVRLAQRTLLVGASTAGKSRRVRALELALDGGASDLSGRAWTSDKRLETLIPANDGALHARAIPSEGDDYTYRKVRKKRVERTNPDGRDHLLLREIETALTGADDRAYRWLLTEATGGVDEDAILALFPSGLRESYGAWATRAHGASAVETLRIVEEQARKQARKQARDAKAQQGVADEVSAGGMPPTGATYEQARQRRDDLRQQHGEAIVQAQQQQRLTRVMAQRRAEIERVRARVQQVQQAGQAHMADEPAGAKLSPEIGDNLKALYRVAVLQGQQATAAGSGTVPCTVCGTVHPAPAFLAHLGTMRQEIHDYTAAGEAHGVWADRLGELQRQHQQLMARLQQLTTAQEDDQAALTALGPVVDPRALAAELQAADRTVQTMDQQRGRWDAGQRARDQAERMGKEAAEHKRVADAAKTAIQTLVEGGIQRFAEDVSSYLPEGWEFAVGTAPFVWGLRAPGESSIRAALSGAETTAVLCAMGSVVARARGGLHVLIPREREIDSTTLAKIMRALKESPAQIVLTSTTPPKRRKVSGWSVVDIAQVEEIQREQARKDLEAAAAAQQREADIPILDEDPMVAHLAKRIEAGDLVTVSYVYTLLFKAGKTADQDAVDDLIARAGGEVHAGRITPRAAP